MNADAAENPFDASDSRISRRAFLRAGSACAGALAAGTVLWPIPAHPVGSQLKLSASDLPEGNAPAALGLDHFPSRVHAFVWRNWTVVPLSVMARVLGATRRGILRMGRAMGLGNPPSISRDQLSRSYITILKRNWHLVPYDQLLDLLGWTPEQLAYTLREDDFLYVKLGNLKPKCAPLRFEKSGPEVLKREERLAQSLREDLPELAVAPAEPLFHFVRQLSAKPRRTRKPVADQRLKFCYSYFALYGDPLLETEADPYPDGYLARLSELGVNGVWLQAVLYKMTPFPWDPALSSGSATRLANLRNLVKRAARHGIRVMLYLNEPRSMPLRFFDQHPELKGAGEGSHAALCTSAPAVQEWIINSIAQISRDVPGLGGYFTISASENFTNCWSHGGGAQCPRCGGRGAAAVIAELIGLFAEGIRRARSRTQLIAWDWSWDDAWASEAIRRLPREAALMSVSEWSLPLERGGVKTTVGEYSISAVGPGPRAQRHWQLARERGLKIFAKIQAGNTWELSTVPYIPVLQNVARHIENLSRLNIDGIMLGWTLGGCPSPNLEVVSETMALSSPGTNLPPGVAPSDLAMRRVAERWFGPDLAPLVCSAWRDLSTAFTEFPLHPGVLYNAPQQLGPANLLWAKPTGYRATMVGFPYDDLNGWRAVFPPDTFAEQFLKVAEGFSRTLEKLRTEAGEPRFATREQRRNFVAEGRVIEAAAIHFHSVAIQARYLIARHGVAAAKPGEGVESHRQAMEDALRLEIRLARRLCQIQMADSRVGFEASNHYFYIPADFGEKILNCRHLLESARAMNSLPNH